MLNRRELLPSLISSALIPSLVSGKDTKEVYYNEEIELGVYLSHSEEFQIKEDKFRISRVYINENSIGPINYIEIPITIGRQKPGKTYNVTKFYYGEYIVEEWKYKDSNKWETVKEYETDKTIKKVEKQECSESVQFPKVDIVCYGGGVSNV